MIISFISNWVLDSKKERFFRFPEAIPENPWRFFEREIAVVVPQNICFEKATLAETIYGARGQAKEKVIVRRALVQQLALKPVAINRAQFNLDYMLGRINAVRDLRIKRILIEFHNSQPDENGWKIFCENFRLFNKHGGQGPRVLSVLLNVGPSREYKDLSKDGSGAYLVVHRKGLSEIGERVWIRSSNNLQAIRVLAEVYATKKCGVIAVARLFHQA